MLTYCWRGTPHNRLLLSIDDCFSRTHIDLSRVTPTFVLLAVSDGRMSSSCCDRQQSLQKFGCNQLRRRLFEF